jgi:hypothetical protein
MSDMSPEARALLDSAIPGLEPPGDARDRVRARVAAPAAVVAASKSTAGATAATIAGGAVTAGGAGVAAAGAGAAATGAAAGAGAASAAGAAVTMGVTTKIIASLAVVSAVSVGTITYTQTKRAEPAPIAATVSTIAAPAVPATTDSKVARRGRNGVAPSTDPSADLASASTMDPTPVVAVAPTSAPLIPTPPVLPPPASSATLSAEIALLSQANALLAGGDPARALALLDEHRRLYPRGALVEERDAARVLALCGAGRHSEGIAARGRFLREHATSPQLARVQNACATPGSGIQRDFPQ